MREVQIVQAFSEFNPQQLLVGQGRIMFHRYYLNLMTKPDALKVIHDGTADGK